MEPQFANSYAYVPVRFDLSKYSPILASERKRRIMDTPRRAFPLEVGRTVPYQQQLKVPRRLGITGHTNTKGHMEAVRHGGCGRLAIWREVYRENPNSLGVNPPRIWY